MRRPQTDAQASVRARDHERPRSCVAVAAVAMGEDQPAMRPPRETQRPSTASGTVPAGARENGAQAKEARMWAGTASLHPTVHSRTNALARSHASQRAAVGTAARSHVRAAKREATRAGFGAPCTSRGRALFARFGAAPPGLGSPRGVSFAIGLRFRARLVTLPAICTLFAEARKVSRVFTRPYTKTRQRRPITSTKSTPSWLGSPILCRQHTRVRAGKNGRCHPRRLSRAVSAQSAGERAAAPHLAPSRRSS